MDDTFLEVIDGLSKKYEFNRLDIKAGGWHRMLWAKPDHVLAERYKSSTDRGLTSGWVLEVDGITDDTAISFTLRIVSWSEVSFITREDKAYIALRKASLADPNFRFDVFIRQFLEITKERWRSNW
jgi:hypothetical protein